MNSATSSSPAKNLANTRKPLAMMTRTKTVATVGPASSRREQLVQLILHGVDVFRLNMAHGKRPDHEAAIDNIRWASQHTQAPVGILVDLAGPKIRLGRLSCNPLKLKTGSQVELVRGNETNDEHELVSLYEPLIDEIAPGDALVLADGISRLEVISKTADSATCIVIDGGKVRSRQGINLPGTHLSVPAFGEVDRDNAIWAAKQGVDFVGLSFVRNAGEIKQLEDVLVANDSSAITIAKIEKREALANLESIIEASGAIMVARGDLGVEIDIEKTPLAQKRIIKTCLSLRKPVIVATQMLESMHNTKQPTRAEVSDVANAILDGADACMLSGETAIGEYPVEAVAMMQKIMHETEQLFDGRSSRMTAHDKPSGWSISDAVVFGAAQIARRVGAKLVVFATSTGDAALMKSKQRDFIPTVCITDQAEVYRRMSLYWGVTPVLAPQSLTPENLHGFIDNWAKEHVGLHAGDPLVIVCDTELVRGVHDTVMVTEID